MDEKKSILALRKRDLKLIEKNLEYWGGYNESCKKAKALVQKVASDIQGGIEYHISNLVSMALASVFEDPFSFEAKFVERRGKIECDLLFKRGEFECEPIEESGWGDVDVASFALQASLFAIKPTRHLIWLDEPFKFVEERMHEKCAEMIKMISEELKVQIIMISHLPKIKAYHDKIITVKRKGKISYAE